MEEELFMSGPWGLEVRYKTCTCEVCRKLEELRQEVGDQVLCEMSEAVQAALVQSGGPVGPNLWYVATSCRPLADYAPLKKHGDEVFNAWVLQQAVQTGLYAGWGPRYCENPLRRGCYGVRN